VRGHEIVGKTVEEEMRGGLVGEAGGEETPSGGGMSEGEMGRGWTDIRPCWMLLRLTRKFLDIQTSEVGSWSVSCEELMGVDYRGEGRTYFEVEYVHMR
jgi:hypothetical protein